jgi:hypothetical protein
MDRELLEPIGRPAPGIEGIVDLYLMPAYDDIEREFLAVEIAMDRLLELATARGHLCWFLSFLPREW